MRLLHRLTRRDSDPKRPPVLWYGCTVLALVATIGTASLALEQPGPAGVGDPGLRGILPSEVPMGLWQDDLAALDGNWATWSQELADELARFYEDETVDPATQRQLLASLRSRVNVMEQSLGDARYRSLHAPMTSIYGKLLRRVDVAEAVLATLNQDLQGARQTALQTGRGAIGSRLNELESYLGGISGGSRWLDFIEAPALRQALNHPPEAGLPVDLLERVAQKLAPQGQFQNADQEQFVSRPPFQALRGTLAEYARLSQVPDEGTYREQLRNDLGSLVTALEEYETTHSTEAGQQVRASYGRIRRMVPQGAPAITTALQTHYFNYNFRLLASDGLVSRLLSDSRQDTGPVHDFVLGARVGGRQWTTSTVNVDLKPSLNGIRFDINLTGVTRSSTQGVTSQATIFTSGYHTFWASKEVQFDGDFFRTSPALIAVDANNTTVGARTRYSWVPLIGGLTNRIAVREAQRRQPQSEAIAAGRVRDRIAPEFNGEVDRQFAEAAGRLQTDVWQRLRDLGWYPDTRVFQSTDNYLKVNTRLMREDELGANTPRVAAVPTSGATVMLHESLLNNAADEMGFAGRAMTDEQVRAELQAKLSHALNRQVNLPARDQAAESANTPNVYLFAAEDPIRFRIDNGTIALIIRSGFRQQARDGEEQREDIPTQEITVPLAFTLAGSDILIERGDVQVSPVERPRSAASQIANAGVIRQKIQAAIPERRVDRVVHLTGDNRNVTMAVTEVVARNGWVSVSVE